MQSTAARTEDIDYFIQQAGTAIIYSDFVLHRVTPVTPGRRYGLVVRIKGPAWC